MCGNLLPGQLLCISTSPAAYCGSSQGTVVTVPAGGVSCDDLISKHNLLPGLFLSLNPSESLLEPAMPTSLVRECVQSACNAHPLRILKK